MLRVILLGLSLLYRFYPLTLENILAHFLLLLLYLFLLLFLFCYWKIHFLSIVNSFVRKFTYLLTYLYEIPVKCINLLKIQSKFYENQVFGLEILFHTCLRCFVFLFVIQFISTKSGFFFRVNRARQQYLTGEKKNRVKITVGVKELD